MVLRMIPYGTDVLGTSEPRTLPARIAVPRTSYCPTEEGCATRGRDSHVGSGQPRSIYRLWKCGDGPALVTPDASCQTGLQLSIQMQHRESSNWLSEVALATLRACDGRPDFRHDLGDWECMPVVGRPIWNPFPYRCRSDGLLTKHSRISPIRRVPMGTTAEKLRGSIRGMPPQGMTRLPDGGTAPKILAERS
jgi:hypothetical protein